MKRSNILEQQNKKKVFRVISPGIPHWVGNGFNVNTMIAMQGDIAALTSPFLLMDYAAPRNFSPTNEKLGVGEHPHRGFETVTFALSGEVTHRDSAGGGGTIGTGDVQWMTAGSGLVHEEFHSQDFAEKGGAFEMLQLWVNLPKDKKMTAPKYQSLKADSFPEISLAEGGRFQVVAGSYGGHTGPASTFTPIILGNLLLEKKSKQELDLLPESNTMILVRRGSIEVADMQITEGQLVIFEQSSDLLIFENDPNTELVLLNGEPINEPIVHYGPFVMNTKAEIMQAFNDFEAGKMGSLVREAGE